MLRLIRYSVILWLAALPVAQESKLKVYIAADMKASGA